MSAVPISIIVLSKNPGARLATALQSVWIQNAAPELVVVDGGSTDGTREWLEAHREKITVLICEPDKGVYDAMNKGLAAAQGRWVLFLGADDRLTGPLVLSEAQSRLEKTSAGVVAGEVAYDDGRIYKLHPSVNPLARNFVHHQGTFYRRALFDQAGGFDATLAIMGDFDLNLRLWKIGARFKSLPLRIAECASNGLSDAGRWQGYREEIAVRHRHGSAARCWLWDAASVVRYFRKKVIRMRPNRHRGLQGK